MYAHYMKIVYFWSLDSLTMPKELLKVHQDNDSVLMEH